MASTEQRPGVSAPTAHLDTRKRIRRVQKMKIDFARLQTYFGMPLHEAAEKLGVSTTTVKKKCRELGVKSWPRATRGNKDNMDETGSVNQQLQPANRSPRLSPSPEHESESDISVPNRSTSGNESAGSQSPVGGAGSNGESDGPSVGRSDSSRTTADAQKGSQDSSSANKHDKWNAAQFPFGLGQPLMFGFPPVTTNNASQIPRSDLGFFPGNYPSLYPLSLAPQSGFVQPQPNSMPTSSQGQFASAPSAGHLSSSQVGAHYAPSNSHPFSTFVPSSQPTAKDMAAANVSQETQNLQLLQEQTRLQMMRLQRAEMDLKIQSLQQSLGQSGASTWPA